MSLREEQCNKVCRILDDVLANRPTERDSLIVAVRKAFEAEPQYKTNYGFMWLCPKCGLPVHSDYTKCVRCGHNREKGV